jgi:hypothetical protein
MGVNDFTHGDRFAYAKYFEAGQVQYTDSTAGIITFTMPAGWYYTLWTTTGFYNGAQAYFKRFEDELNSRIALTASANRIYIDPATPANCNALFFTDSTTRLTRKAGGLNWTITLLGLSTQHALGFDQTQTINQANSTGNQVCAGRWQSPVITCDRRLFKRREAFRNQGGRTHYSNWWDGYDIREFEWKNVPASHVRDNPFPQPFETFPLQWDSRPGKTSFLEPQLTNSFNDMWREALRGGYPIAAKYNVTSFNPDPSTWPAELLKPIDSQWEEQGAIATDFGPDEAYRLTFKAEVL